MITPSFCLTATERVLPNLALDFTTASLDSRVTFTRTTGASNPATYINSSGVLTTATNNQPRFDFDPITLSPKGLLIEEQRTNLSTSSNNFSGWTMTGASFVPSQTTSPDAALNGWKLTENNALSGHYGYSTKTGLTASTAYTYSIYAKADGSGRKLVGYPSGGATGSWRVNLATGAVEGGSAVVVDAGGGFWRISSVYTTGSGVTSCLVWLALYNGATSYQGDGVSGAYVFGEQLEAGSFATSYIPTTTTSLTRNADVVSMTGTNFSDWYNASAGSWYIQTNARNAATVLTAGSFTLAATTTGLKKYANSYAIDQSATSLVFGQGTVAKVSYYKQALLTAELAALTN